MVRSKKTKLLELVKSITLLFLCLVIGGYFFIESKTYEAMPKAMEEFKQENVVVEDKVIIFNPISEPVANLVFYQGGLVETESYAVLGHLLADEGIRVFMPKMSMNLSILNINAFDNIYKKYNDGNDWFIGGHSLGGASASIYVSKNKDIDIKGIFFLGAYPSENSDLSQLPLSVVSINATNDQIINNTSYLKTKSLLPSNTVFVDIKGGNHSNYGYYGLQKGDGESEISREEQHEQVVNALLEMIVEEKQNK